MNAIRPLLCASLVLSCTATAQQHAAANTTTPQPFLTPLVMQTGHEPIPVKGSDGRYHLVYELELANYSGDRVSAGQLQILDADSHAVLAESDAAQVAARLVVRDRAATPGEFGASQLGILYLHVTIGRQRDIPSPAMAAVTPSATSAPRWR
jgi:hypothetical protein